MATKKKGAGRPTATDKVKVVSAYLKKSEQNKVEKRYGNITEALRVEVLPKCV